MASSLTSIQQQPAQQASLAQAASSSHQHQTLPGNLVGRELKLIASSFVKQYYTLLNKAPCFIHNFYNHDSTFIHGTIEMGSDNHTEPVVGREKIEEKMKELQLNDCRAKIKQIDCLETLAGGLVLQVIGELSNDGKPMRRFLQTFVLAPSPDQTRHDGDSHTQNKAHDNRRGVQISENSSNSSHNQKFYVLNSIFRYQDDGPDSEFEDDVVSVKANTSVENGPEQLKNEAHNMRVKPATAAAAAQPLLQQQQKLAAPAEQPKISTKLSIVSEQAPTSSEQQKRSEVKVVAPNGTSNSARKGDISEKVSYENGKVAPNDSQTQTAPTKTSIENIPSPAAASQTASSAQTPVSAAPANTSLPVARPSNEPKTWANMVRNALPPSAAVQHPATAKEQPSLTQSTQAHNPSQQQQIPHQQQPSQSQNEHQQSNNNNNNSNNRRRHMIRKTSNNKTGNGHPSGGGTATVTATPTTNATGIGSGTGNGSGRTMKHKPARPATAAAPTSKPAA